MGNTYGAHIFKRAKVGEREEVTIKLFMPDGTPLELGGEPPDPDAGGDAPVGTMVYRSTWVLDQNYKKYDVVMYNPGDGYHTYIFDQDHNAGTPQILDVNGTPINKFWDPAVGFVDLVLDANSKVGNGGMVPGRYDVFAIKINESGGYLSLRAVDTLARAQDLGAMLWHQKPDSTWELVVSDDDGSGSGKPWIRYSIPVQHIMPGVYSYYISRYSSGTTEASAEGTTRVSPAVDNTAVIGSFADFPMTKVTRIG